MRALIEVKIAQRRLPDCEASSATVTDIDVCKLGSSYPIRIAADSSLRRTETRRAFELYRSRRVRPDFVHREEQIERDGYRVIDDDRIAYRPCHAKIIIRNIDGDRSDNERLEDNNIKKATA